MDSKIKDFFIFLIIFFYFMLISGFISTLLGYQPFDIFITILIIYLIIFYIFFDAFIKGR